MLLCIFVNLIWTLGILGTLIGLLAGLVVLIVLGKIIVGG